jgi:hypothetical protein
MRLHSRLLLVAIALFVSLPSALGASSARAQLDGLDTGFHELVRTGTVIHSAERVHRVRVRDQTPFDLFHLTIGGVAMRVEALEVTRDDGTTVSLPIARSFGSSGLESRGIYLRMCGGPARITRLRVLHATGDPRFNTTLRLTASVYQRDPDALELPCEARPDALSATEPVAHYPWGSTLELVRAQCARDGGVLREVNALRLECAPFAPLAAESARFDFASDGGLTHIVVLKSREPASNEALRRLLAPHVAALGLPTISADPDFCDGAFFRTLPSCAGSFESYQWQGTHGGLLVRSNSNGVIVSYSAPGQWPRW